MSFLKRIAAAFRGSNRAQDSQTSSTGIDGPGPNLDQGGQSEGQTPFLDQAGGEQSAAERSRPITASSIGVRNQRGPITGEQSVSILQDAFGSYRTITNEGMQVLPQAEFQVAWDAIYLRQGRGWQDWVVPTHGNLNGFVHGGINYINRDSANLGTVPHEMLHNNAASDWRPFVGTQIDEGATDILKQYALQRLRLRSPNSYPNQIACVQALVDNGLGQQNLFNAYLRGGAATIVGRYMDQNCVGTFAQFKAAMEAQDWARARALTRRK